MAHLHLSLLGPFNAFCNGDPLTGFRSDKVRALLVYLAVESQRRHRRETLGALLWPDQAPASVKNNLRVSLSRLRQVLDDAHASLPFLLQPNNKTLQFNPEADFELDVDTFTRLMERCATHPHRHGDRCRTCMVRLAQAVDLYRGDFLQGLNLPDASSFEEWALLRRENLRRDALWALHQLGVYHERRGDLRQAHAYTRRQMTLDPWSEQAYRRVMRVLARSGERNAALAEYQRLCQLLDEELGVEPEAETTALFDQIRRTGSPGPGPDALPPHNLPTQPTPLIGREAELLDLSDQLLDPAYRLVTLAGEGGVGKSRLAQAVAAAVCESFVDGVWYVSLVGVGRTPASGQDDLPADTVQEWLAGAIVNALNAHFLDNQSLQVQVLRHLRDRELLLVLDNFEHLLGGLGFVVELIRRCPHVALLVTSRVPLNLQSEYVVPVSGLPLPAADSLAAAADFASVQLFVERADRSQGGFALRVDNLSDVVDICRFVDGMPLGIELAAAQIRTQSSAQIARKLHQNLDFLATSMQDIPLRHRSMKSVFEGSWRLLIPEEQAILSRCSVFRGSFTIEAAQAITNASPAQLCALEDRFLLRRVEPDRYDIHALLRQFAEEKLVYQAAAVPSASSPHRRHGHYYLQFVAERAALLVSAQARVASEAIRAELDNVRWAWRWVVNQPALDLLVESVPALTEYYYLAGLFQEGATLFAEAAERVGAMSARTQEEGRPNRRIQVQAMLLVEHAYFHVTLSRYDGTESVLLRALDLAQTGEDRRTEARAYWVQGLLAWRLGHFAEAEDTYVKGLHLARLANAPHIEAACLRDQGIMRDIQDDPAQAQVLFQQALAIQRRIGHRQGEGATLCNIGIVHERFGAYSKANQVYAQALLISEEVGDLRSMGINHNNLGVIALRIGAFDRAKVHLMQALEIRRQIGDLLGEESTTINLSWLFYRCGDAEEALIYAQRAHQLAIETQQPREEGVVFNFLGYIYLTLGDLTPATENFRQALQRNEEYDYGYAVIESKAGLTQAALLQANLPLSYTYCQEILPLPDGYAFFQAGEPFQTYLTCYEVLRACSDPRALSVLQEAHDHLRQQAAQISDGKEQRMFLENIPAHRQILAHVQCERMTSSQQLRRVLRNKKGRPDFRQKSDLPCER